MRSFFHAKVIQPSFNIINMLASFRDSSIVIDATGIARIKRNGGNDEAIMIIGTSSELRGRVVA